jgi:IS30 family transposase
LSEDERVTLGDLRREGNTVRAIARALGRSPSTISRELARNQSPDGKYRPFHAHRTAAAKRSRPGRGRLLRDPVLRKEVEDRLRDRWSPEQVSRHLTDRFPDDPSRHLVPESIYQAVYRPELGGLHRLTPKVLRTGRRHRRPRARPDARRGRLVDMVMIADRPAIATDRCNPGSWEGDLIIGKDNRSAIGTLVERCTRTTLLLHLGGQRGADAVRDALIDMFAEVPPELRISLTWDQGSEMAHHTQITQQLGLPVYFCDPHSPWQRPSNENTNGLLRDYFPKSTDLNVHTPEDLTRVAAELNNRPRKTLGWVTPAHLLTQILTTPLTGTTIEAQTKLVLRR